MLKLLLTDFAKRNEKSGYVNMDRLRNRAYKFPGNFDVKCQSKRNILPWHMTAVVRPVGILPAFPVSQKLLSTCDLFSFTSLHCFVKEGNPQYFSFGLVSLCHSCHFSFFVVSSTYALHTEF
jgi:hypothetical protein